VPDVLPRADLVKAVVFDVDGTLYRQGPVRRAMVVELAKAYWRRPVEGTRTMRMIAAYRRAQEELRAAGFEGDVTLEQAAVAAKRTGADAETVRAAVERWMETAPLGAVGTSARSGLVDAVGRLAAMGIPMAAVSDYPAERKLEALGVRDHFAVVVTAQDARVGSFKPNPRGLLLALEELGVEPAAALFIGDRADVDAKAATAADVPYLLIGGSRRRGTADRENRIDTLGQLVDLLEAR
jgi:HAD superfamily hydrolase (TIGR01509 family)